MATAYYPPAPYQPYAAPTAANPISYRNTSDPRQLAQNQRQIIQGQGDARLANQEKLANQYLGDASGTQAYLNPIEGTLAAGGGGYTPEEASQIQLAPQDKAALQLSPETRSHIELSPQDAENIVTGAGISAGGRTAADVAAAERGAAAAGGNPAAVAAYRARATATGAAAAGDAMTQARIAAKQATAQGATTAEQLKNQGITQGQELSAQGGEAVGGARMGQQNQGLQYFGGLQGQQTQAGLTEQQLGNQTFGTTTGGTGAAADIGLKASQTPSTTDKLIGGIAGAASSFLADGHPYFDEGIDAVVGEDGPEAIVKAASDPVRSDTKFMAEGYLDDDPGAPGYGVAPSSYGADAGNTDDPGAPGAQPGSANSAAWFQRFRQNLAGRQAPGAPGQEKQPWNPASTYSSVGSAVGSLGRALMLADGSVYQQGETGDDGQPLIVTGPTRVRLNRSDEVIPLSYRPTAKVRPSAAVPALRAAYGSMNA